MKLKFFKSCFPSRLNYMASDNEKEEEKEDENNRGGGGGKIPPPNQHTEQEEEDDDENNMNDEEEGFTPPPARGRRQAVAAESYDPTADTQEFTVAFHLKSEQQLDFLHGVASDILFFAKCDHEQQNVLFNAMFEKRVQKDDVIIRQGDDGDNFYIIETGQYDIFVKKGDDGEEKCVTTLEKGYFGELALLYNCPRNATIITKTAGVLWGLDQKTFREIIVKATAQKRQAFEDLLKGVSMLDSLTSYELMDVTDALTEVTLSRDECIIKEGDAADKMYFIMTGEASVQVVDTTTKKQTEIVRLKRGQYFGEFALVLKKPRNASVYVTSQTMKCAVLYIDAFERLLGPCINIMKRNITNYEKERKRLGISTKADETNGTGNGSCGKGK